MWKLSCEVFCPASPGTLRFKLWLRDPFWSRSQNVEEEKVARNPLRWQNKLLPVRMAKIPSPAEWHISELAFWLAEVRFKTARHPRQIRIPSPCTREWRGLVRTKATKLFAVFLLSLLCPPKTAELVADFRALSCVTARPVDTQNFPSVRYELGKAKAVCKWTVECECRRKRRKWLHRKYGVHSRERGGFVA